MLSAISATLLAILEAMMAYAPPTPFAYESPPATEAALFWTGRAFCAGLVPLGVALLTGALEGAAFLVAMPFILGAPLTWGLDAIFESQRSGCRDTGVFVLVRQ